MRSASPSEAPRAATSCTCPAHRGWTAGRTSRRAGCNGTARSPAADAGESIEQPDPRSPRRSAPHRVRRANLYADVMRCGESALPSRPEREPVDVHLAPRRQRRREVQLEADRGVRHRTELDDRGVYARHRSAARPACDEPEAVYAAACLPRPDAHGDRAAHDQDLARRWRQDLDFQRDLVGEYRGSRAPDIAARGEEAAGREEQRRAWIHRCSWWRPSPIKARYRGTGRGASVIVARGLIPARRRSPLGATTGGRHPPGKESADSRRAWIVSHNVLRKTTSALRASTNASSASSVSPRASRISRFRTSQAAESSSASAARRNSTYASTNASGAIVPPSRVGRSAPQPATSSPTNAVAQASPLRRSPPSMDRVPLRASLGRRRRHAAVKKPGPRTEPGTDYVMAGPWVRSHPRPRPGPRFRPVGAEILSRRTRRGSRPCCPVAAVHGGRLPEPQATRWAQRGISHSGRSRGQVP